MAHIEELQVDCHQLAVDKGFWPEGTRDIPEALCLVHSEISEALEEYRNWDEYTPIDKWYGEDRHKPEGFGVELADAVIRILDLAGGLNIQLADLIQEKLDYNRTRPHRHGKVC